MSLLSILPKLRIAGIDWVVHEYSRGELFEGSGSDLLGECKWRDCEIRLLADMPKERKLSILVHEALHVIADNADIELPDGTLRILSCGIFAMLQDNPSLLGLLAEQGRAQWWAQEMAAQERVG